MEPAYLPHDKTFSFVCLWSYIKLSEYTDFTIMLSDSTLVCLSLIKHNKGTRTLPKESALWMNSSLRALSQTAENIASDDLR